MGERKRQSDRLQDLSYVDNDSLLNRITVRKTRGQKRTKSRRGLHNIEEDVLQEESAPFRKSESFYKKTVNSVNTLNEVNNKSTFCSEPHPVEIEGMSTSLKSNQLNFDVDRFENEPLSKRCKITLEKTKLPTDDEASKYQKHKSKRKKLHKSKYREEDDASISQNKPLLLVNDDNYEGMELVNDSSIKSEKKPKLVNKILSISINETSKNEHNVDKPKRRNSIAVCTESQTKNDKSVSSNNNSEYILGSFFTKRRKKEKSIQNHYDDFQNEDHCRGNFEKYEKIEDDENKSAFSTVEKVPKKKNKKDKRHSLNNIMNNSADNLSVSNSQSHPVEGDTIAPPSNRLEFDVERVNNDDCKSDHQIKNSKTKKVHKRKYKEDANIITKKQLHLVNDDDICEEMKIISDSSKQPKLANKFLSISINETSRTKHNVEKQKRRHSISVCTVSKSKNEKSALTDTNNSDNMLVSLLTNHQKKSKLKQKIVDNSLNEHNFNDNSKKYEEIEDGKSSLCRDSLLKNWESLESLSPNSLRMQQVLEKNKKKKGNTDGLDKLKHSPSVPKENHCKPKQFEDEDDGKQLNNSTSLSSIIFQNILKNERKDLYGKDHSRPSHTKNIKSNKRKRSKRFSKSNNKLNLKDSQENINANENKHKRKKLKHKSVISDTTKQKMHKKSLTSNDIDILRNMLLNKALENRQITKKSCKKDSKLSMENTSQNEMTHKIKKPVQVENNQIQQIQQSLLSKALKTFNSKSKKKKSSKKLKSLAKEKESKNENCIKVKQTKTQKDDTKAEEDKKSKINCIKNKKKSNKKDALEDMTSKLLTAALKNLQ